MRGKKFPGMDRHKRGAVSIPVPCCSHNSVKPKSYQKFYLQHKGLIWTFYLWHFWGNYGKIVNHIFYTEFNEEQFICDNHFFFINDSSRNVVKLIFNVRAALQMQKLHRNHWKEDFQYVYSKTVWRSLRKINLCWKLFPICYKIITWLIGPIHTT